MIDLLEAQHKQRELERRDVSNVILGHSAFDELRVELFQFTAISQDGYPRITVEGVDPMIAGQRHLGLVLEFRVGKQLMSAVCDESLMPRAVKWPEDVD